MFTYVRVSKYKDGLYAFAVAEFDVYDTFYRMINAHRFNPNTRGLYLVNSRTGRLIESRVKPWDATTVSRSS